LRNSAVQYMGQRNCIEIIKKRMPCNGIRFCDIEVNF
jgi:hypothetical protein